MDGRNGWVQAGQMTPCELRLGVSGKGTTIYVLFIGSGATGSIERFPTKSEALAWHGCGTNYLPLNDLT